MSHHQRGLVLRALLAFLGFVLALESYILKPNLQLNFSFDSSQNNNYDSGWSNDYEDNDYDSGGWDFGGGDDTSWDSSGGWDDNSWDSGGDSGSWDDSGGDSGGW